MPNIEAQSSGNSYTLQAGDEITEIKIGGVGKTIVDWLKSLFGGAAGAVIWDAIKAKWNAQPFTPSTGTIVAYAEVILTDLDGERIYWYGVSGKPISKIQYSLDDPFGMPMKLREDYQYYDFTYVRMTWNSDDKINSRHNQGENGAYYPEHEDYYKGKKGYIITWGTANKHDLTHQFCSDVDENSRDSALADAAEKEKLDKFKPKAYAYLSDMRYKSDGWNYKRRTKPVVHQKI